MLEGPNTETYADFKARLLLEIWPEGAPENIAATLTAWFNCAMMEIQREVPCVQAHNFEAYRFCATFFNAWTTFAPFRLPFSYIRRVFTVSNGDFTNKVWYQQSDFGRVLEWSQNLLCNIIGAPPGSALPSGLIGDRPADQLTDKYSMWGFPVNASTGRARRGIWAMEKGRLWLAPWIQSNETIYVEWDGVKTRWCDTDLIDLDVWHWLFQKAIKWFIKYQYQASFEADRTAEQFAGEHWKNELALLIIDCREQQQLRTQKPQPETYSPSSSQLVSEQITITPTITYVGVIANYGVATGDPNIVNASAVADLVNGWNPSAVVTAGGNNLGDDADVSAWDFAVGQFYSSLLKPYEGSFGTGGAENKFWPALDDSEIVALDTFQEYFGALQRRRYYTTLVGDIQFFVLDSSQFEPDGNIIGSVQAVWLQVAMAMSMARWRVVVLRGNPFSSGPNGGVSSLQWPFRQWGADLVISGDENHYERLCSGGLSYIVCGMGGAALTPSYTPVAQSIVQDDSHFGAIQMKSTQPYAIPGVVGPTSALFNTQPPTMSPATLEVSFIDISGVARDYLKLTKTK